VLQACEVLEAGPNRSPPYVEVIEAPRRLGPAPPCCRPRGSSSPHRCTRRLRVRSARRRQRRVSHAARSRAPSIRARSREHRHTSSRGSTSRGGRTGGT
jgi:hypothetical protein